jgi:hypothetical protein
MKRLNLLWIVALGFLINACNKSDTNNTGNGGDGAKAKYTVMMTDTPGPYQQVNIDIKGVEITGNGGKQVLLNVNAGIYNLLDFTNGMDTMIATGSIDAGTVEQIRLILGPNNTVVVNGDTHLLDVPSGEQSGLKLQVHQKIEAGVSYIILLDFDANQSIVKLGNGGYKLKPVIRTINHAIGGSVKGSITPAGVAATVTASDGVNSYSSMVDASGNFIIMGLPPGTYTVTIVPVSPYNTVVKTGVAVTAGNSTDIGVSSVL